MPASMPRAVLPLFGVAFHTCTSIRIASDETFNVATRSCKNPVQEKDGQCESDGEALPFYCCNTLRSCRRDANDYLEYYTKYLEIYEKPASCAVTDADFTVSRDGQELTLNDGKSKVCDNPHCKNDQDLREKPYLHVSKADLTLECTGKVEDNEWRTQLDSANWPAQKVMALDKVWVTCGVAITTTTTTAIWIATMTTTTVTYTAKEPEFEEVDMSFMGNDQTHPGRTAVGLRFWRWGYRRINPDVKEEVTRNHFCAKTGDRDQTYYASTLCYWIPDKETSEIRNSRGVGLAWVGSLHAGVNGPICHGLEAESGKCVKCSTCHNNAMSEDGKVTYTSWAEKIALSSTCKKETEIEAYCLGVFEDHNKQLVQDVTACTQEQREYQTAFDEFRRVNLTIPALKRLIDHDIPAQINALTTTIDELTPALRQRQLAEQDFLSDQLEPPCEKAVENDLNFGGYPAWWVPRPSRRQEPLRDILNLMTTTFVVGDRPRRGEWDFDRKMNYWDEKTACRAKMDELDAYNRITNEMQHDLDQLKANRKAAQDDLANRHVQLQANEELLPIVKAEYDTKKTSWVDSGRQKECEEHQELFDKIRPPRMRECIRDEFKNSCEKECLEKQGVRYEGCGVMEGALPSDPTSKGGVVGGCLPPYPSWMMGPVAWGAEEERASTQCSRIFTSSNQTPRHAQRILASGWLEKRSRWKTHYNRRFFMFESGDQVRSAVIRYWKEDDPNINRHAPELVRKKIIVWDAKKVEASGKYCFILYHFYRNYKLCPEDQQSTTRDTWVDLIKKYLRFAGK